MFFFENVLLVASRMRFVLMSSWLGLRVGWTLLKDLRKNNMLSLLKTEKPSFIPRTKLVTPTPPSTPLKIQKLTRAKMDECQIKGLYYNCDDKYYLRHKCKEQNLFMAISEDVSEEDVEAPLVLGSPEPTDITPPSDPP
jgi:hypothetical protein